MLKSKRNTKDRTLYTCRTVPYDLPGMTEPKQCCRHRYFSYSVVGAINSHTRRIPGINSVVGAGIYRTRRTWYLAYLKVSTVWQAPTSAIPEEDDATSHVHLTLNSIMGVYHHLVPVGVGSKT